MDGLGDLAAWWTQQMRELVPARWRAGDDAGEAVLLVPYRDPGGDPAGFEAVRRRPGGTEIPLGRFAADAAGLAAARGLFAGSRKAPRLLLVPAPGEVLERTLHLPLATERGLARVLTWEMDRLTPFAADELFWDYQVLGRDRAADRIGLRLTVVPKAGLEPRLRALGAAGLAPVALAVRRLGGGLRVIGLAPPGAADAAGGPGRRAVAVAAGGCAALAVAAAALPFVLQARALGAVEARIERLRPAIAEIEALRRRAAGDAGAGAEGGVADGRRRPVLPTLAALTAALPDDTHLTALTLKGDALSLTGQSAAAARLIPALAAQPTFRDVAFAAPVTRAAGEGRADLFTVRADLGP